MRRRAILDLLRRRLAAYPAVALTGPRQAGKTTLARSLGGAYFDLEQEGDRLRLEVRWPAVAAGRALVVLDEAQAYPAIFPRLRGAIDRERQRRGRFLLLGSVAPALMRQVSESLAGRLALVELTPFLLEELPRRTDLDALWFAGGFPEGGILAPGRYPQWQKNFLDLLAQRDLPNWGLQAGPQVTARLFRMLAAIHGQIWNASQVGQSLGLTHPTVNTYLDFLEGTFLVRRLLPFHANLKKRLVKSPKCYWRDSGLLHALLGVADADDLLGRPWVGASWEGFALEQILGKLSVRDLAPLPYFLRTSDGHEIDLVLDFGRSQWAVEIKLSSDPSPEDLARLNRTADLIQAERRILVSRTTRPVAAGKTLSCSLPHLLSLLEKGELRT